MKKIIIVLLSIYIIVCNISCDKVGNLNEEETKQIYAEIKEDVQTGRLWDLKPLYWHEDKDIKDNLSFLQLAIGTVYDNENLILSKFGGWYSKKSYCKLIRIICEVPYSEGNGEYIIDDLTIAKYYKYGNYKIWLHYHESNSDNESKYIEAEFHSKSVSKNTTKPGT